MLKSSMPDVVLSARAVKPLASAVGIQGAFILQRFAEKLNQDRSFMSLGLGVDSRNGQTSRAHPAQ